MSRNRDVLFGRLLAVANVLSERVFENDRIKISQKHMSRFANNPALTFERIHKELMEYADKFGPEEIHLMDLFTEIFAEMNEEDFSNEPLKGVYLHGYHSQQSLLNNVIGVEEAATILGLSPGTVKNKCAAGELPAKKIGKTWVLDKNRLN
jgi:excisionase family DNA binding protein